MPDGIEYSKGFYGVQTRTVAGLHRNVGEGGSAQSPGDPAWDIWVGPLPFLLASSPERTYVRETAPVRRDRFDSARDPGENSLDSSLWLRSWTSWHLGAGQDQAEPLETDPEIARFRFRDSAGVDPWTAGRVSLLHACEFQRGGIKSLTAHPELGVVAASATTGVRLITASSDTQIATNDVESVEVSGTKWYGVDASGVVYHGLLSGGVGAAVPVISGATVARWAKDRLWVGAGADLYEVTDPSSGTQVPFHTFRDGEIIDIDTGAGGLYVMVDQGLTYIYVIAANTDGTLAPPEEVAVLPRGERGTVMYGYLSRYLTIGTTRGVRVADCSTTESLTVGPLVIEMDGGCVDATADSNFLWVTGGYEGVDVDGDGSDVRPCLYRLDLSRQVAGVAVYGDNAAGRYPYATDMYTPVEKSGRAMAVTTHDGQVYWTDSSGDLWVEQPDQFVEKGWLTSGEVNYATAEMKAWQSIFAEVEGTGYVSVEADTGAGFAPVTQNPLVAPRTGDVAFDGRIHAPSTSIELRMRMWGGGTSTPQVLSAAMRALPAPKRNRFVRIPLLAFDYEIDRVQQPVGYEGFAYDRVKDLESMEEVGGIVQVTDTRSGETLTCQIDRVTFSSESVPDRAKKNWGGIVTLTLLSV